MAGERQPFVVEMRRHYGLEVYDFKEEGKGWVVDTNQGTRYLQSTSDSEAELLFQYSIYTQLKNKDFSHFFTLYETREGKPYFHMGESIFQLFAWERFHKVKFKNPEDLKNVIKILSEFHQASQGFKAVPGCRVRTEWGRWPWVFRANYTLGVKLRQLLKEKSTKERVERLILETIEEYLEIAKKSIEGIKNTAYLEMVGDSMQKNELCIQQVGAKNFVKDRENRYKIISLQEVKHDLPVMDVAHLLLENMEEEPILKEIVRQYNLHRELTEDELQIVKAYVQFPHEYFKILERYYKNKKDVSQGDWEKKMKKVLKIERAKKNFMKIDL